MDAMTPSVLNGHDILNTTKCDGIELTKDLFKDHKMSIDDNKSERLNTYLRIRSVPEFDVTNRQQCYQVIDGNILEVIPPKDSKGSDGKLKRYKFNHIMEESVDQTAVYETCGLPLVQRFLKGENGLLFAYGITSSGKSYTMRGSTTSPGIIPRALQTVFEVIGHKLEKEVPHLKPISFSECQPLSENDRQLENHIRQYMLDQTTKNYKFQINSFRSQISVINESSANSTVWTDVLHSTFRSNESNIRCSVWISFFEIYNDKIHDLLNLDVEGEKKANISVVKDMKSDNYCVKGLRQICVTSAEEAFKVLLFGQNNLHVSSTDLNKTSSRSHCAFTISLVTTFDNTYVKRPPHINHLSICDLAGAERSDKANSKGDRLLEASKINSSLFSLGHCLTTLRNNQKYLHDPSKQRIAFTTKLTRVFQPYLSGNGSAAMILNMNPLPTLRGETLFAMGVTGIAAQVVVSYEEQRNKLQDSLKRLTQVWMQSSQRWSNFAHINHHKPSISIIHTIREEDEDDSDGDLDISAEDVELKINELTQMDLSRADPQELEVLRTQIDFLVDKLKQTGIDKFEMEVEVRRQVVSEYKKLIQDLEDMAEDKDKAKKSLEEMMTNRLLKTENIHRQEKLEFESRLNKLETELFEIREDNCRFKEERDSARTEVELINRVLSDKEQLIKELESQVNGFKDTVNSSIEKCVTDVNTSPIKWQLSDASTTTLNVELHDMNCSAINVIDVKDINTSAIDQNMSAVDLCDRGVGNSFVAHMDNETSTYNVMDMSDKCTSVSFEASNNNSINSQSIANVVTEETETDFVNESDVTIKGNKLDVSPKEMTCSSTSPHISNTNEIMSIYEMNGELLSKLTKYENEMKEKDAMIAYNRQIAVERDQTLKQLTEEITKLREKHNSNPEFNFELLLKNPFKSGSNAGSLSSQISAVTTKSVKSEDLASISSLDSVVDKPKKNSKYSTRKRKPNLNSSVDKRYLKSVDGQLDVSMEPKSSQSSVNSSEPMNDSIGEMVYSHKKANKRAAKRKQTSNNCTENEEYRLSSDNIPMSKRKRPPLKHLYSSPISPIPSAERVTRSRAKKCIQF